MASRIFFPQTVELSFPPLRVGDASCLDRSVLTEFLVVRCGPDVGPRGLERAAFMPPTLVFVTTLLRRVLCPSEGTSAHRTGLTKRWFHATASRSITFRTAVRCNITDTYKPTTQPHEQNTDSISRLLTFSSPPILSSASLMFFWD